MDENEKSQDRTEAEQTADLLRKTADKIVYQERMIAQIKQVVMNLNEVLMPKRYLVTNKITGEKEITNLDDVFSEMIRHLDQAGTLEGWLTKFNVIKLKEETVDVLYGESKDIPK